MSSVAELQSGKGHQDENFPVASFLIAPRHRAPVLAFYKFVRAADDVSDNARVAPEEKLALLEQMRQSLVGESNAVPEGVALRAILEERGLSPVHALDLLEAFRRDCTKLRYRDWDDLIDYCRYSAMPVGRFVLDVHGESHALWPANDALCAALQVINHLQDCKADYLEMNRVYVPVDHLKAEGIGVEALAEPRTSPALRRVLDRLLDETDTLMQRARKLPGALRDTRLRCESATIVRLADTLIQHLRRRDPLAERVKLTKPGMAWCAMQGIAWALATPKSKRTP
jgi:squalene synthase HpnC